jgi:hypothetical protein
MKLSKELRSLFSPYELAAFSAFVQLAIVVGAVALAIGGRSEAAMAILFLLGFVVIFASEELSRCPGCGKRPRKRFLLGMETGIGQIFVAQRFWPERVCSSCGTRLDGI